ncbi:MAG TPA: ATP-binding protein, partial [Acidobacteriota bacterium]|nr:ATP-binding protein [Acidobacteriota bacterium]
DCNTSLNQALANLKVACEERKAVIHFTPLPTILADPSQIVLVFQNLIGNALRFCHDVPIIHISARLQDNEWVFSVKDNGIGIEPRFFERIFVIFQRLHTKSEYPGSGIGLSICKRIVERHGGRIWVQSEPQVGTTFFFSLPAIDS